MTWLQIWLLCGVIGTAIGFIAWYLDCSSEGLKAQTHEESHTAGGVAGLVAYIMMLAAGGVVAGPFTIMITTPALIVMMKRRMK